MKHKFWARVHKEKSVLGSQILFWAQAHWVKKIPCRGPTPSLEVSPLAPYPSPRSTPQTGAGFYAWLSVSGIAKIMNFSQ